ncbi:hypothetical protein [Erythrobacter aureus]|uniref:RES domain-containing protein n=1 Tax=Erythrobacter aureus TaxID=2182384 RepID=A0A345YJB7_9SPHN|nr:hypothetical protein [Erythrobacter aureus]AXK44019.1 hypothetical protein DVR09_16325 [Erythrobacter aureus]
MPRIRVWHATAADFDTFAPFSHFGSRAQAEMRCPPGGHLLEVELLVADPKTMKDTGGWDERQLKRLQKQGWDGVRYLNRYEGIPQSAFERARAKYANIDRLSDANFQKALPEASESWIVFDPRNAKIIAKHEPAEGEGSASLSAELCNA